MSFAKFQEDVEGLLAELGQLEEASVYLQDLVTRINATDDESRNIAAEHVNALQLQFVTPWCDVPIPLPFPADKAELMRSLAVAADKIHENKLELLLLIDGAARQKYSEYSSGATMSVTNTQAIEQAQPQPPQPPPPLRTVPIDEA